MTSPIDEEEWRDIPGWEGLYQASSSGRIRSLDRSVRFGTGSRRVIGKVIKQSRNAVNGYWYARLGHSKQASVHVLVCSAFHGARDGEKEAAHRDGDQNNNDRSNLRWATRLENSADQTIHGTRARWEKMPHSKLTDDQIADVRNSGETGVFLARRLGCSPSLISLIRNRKRRGA